MSSHSFCSQFQATASPTELPAMAETMVRASVVLMPSCWGRILEMYSLRMTGLVEQERAARMVPRSSELSVDWKRANRKSQSSCN